MNQGGFALQIPVPESYQFLLDHYVTIHGRRGVKIGRLWYGKDPVLEPYQGKPSDRGADTRANG